MIPTVIQVALGGAIGASLRYGANLGIGRLLGAAFPWHTLAVNVIELPAVTVAALAAGLGVERGVVQHDDSVITGLGLLHRGAVHIDGGHVGRVHRQVLVAVEARGHTLVFEASRHLELAGGTGLLALVGHGGIKTRLIHGHVALAAYVGVAPPSARL